MPQPPSRRSRSAREQIHALRSDASQHRFGLTAAGRKRVPGPRMLGEREQGGLGQGASGMVFLVSGAASDPT